MARQHRGLQLAGPEQLRVLSRAEVAGADTQAAREDDRFATLDANGDGRLTRSEWREDRADFARADRNGDNVVTRTEFMALETPLEERFESLDRNNNGRIERAEWRGGAERFDTLDRNNDDVVTRDEMLGETDATESGVFTRADSNRDNRLSQREWQWSQRVFTQQDVNRDGFVSREEFWSPGARDVTGTRGVCRQPHGEQPGHRTGQRYRALGGHGARHSGRRRPENHVDRNRSTERELERPGRPGGSKQARRPGAASVPSCGLAHRADFERHAVLYRRWHQCGPRERRGTPLSERQRRPSRRQFQGRSASRSSSGLNSWISVN